jgi:hypothetical protein
MFIAFCVPRTTVAAACMLGTARFAVTIVPPPIPQGA